MAAAASQVQKVKPLTMVLLGAGQRGKVYSQYALERPDLCKVVAVAEPREITRRVVGEAHQVPEELRFADWKDFIAADDASFAAGKGRLAEAAIVTTQDQMHVGPAVALAKRGYQILLEKPMAVNRDECKEIVQAVIDNNVILAVGHVMRYTPYSQSIKKLVDSGALGDIISIQHLEPVGHEHFAHSYVRGSWSREESSSFMLMTKCCHDVDWLCWIMNSKPTRVSSFGSLKHFRKENKPLGASSRCISCSVESTCPYSAKRIYNGVIDPNGKRWAATFLEENTPEALQVALETSKFGRCVYDSENDVVDNQVVIMEFEGGSTVNFSVVAFTKDICVRKTRIFGSLGQLEGDGQRVVYDNFVTGERTVYDSHEGGRPDSKLVGHDYADYYFMKSFVEAASLRDPSLVLSGPQETLHSHLMVFAAEDARVQRKVLDISDW